jgi:hypothetical protein
MLLAWRGMVFAAWAGVTPGTGIGLKELLSRTALPLRLFGSGAYGEVAVDRYRGLRILALAQIVPDGKAAFGPQAVLEPIEHLGGVYLSSRHPPRTVRS